MSEAAPDTYRWWPLSGAGIDHFGDEGRWREAPRLATVPGELVAEVEAFTICASDAKMVRLGSRYPLFGNRNLEREPACLGHELALRVSGVEHGVDSDLRPGVRVGVQPDVYKNGRRLCVGVNLPGGMADQIALGPEVLHSDFGSMVFPVDPRLSRAATALLEPLGCVEAAFRAWGRDGVKPGGRLVVACAQRNAGWILDAELPAATIDLIALSSSAWEAAGGPVHDRVRSVSLAEVLADPTPLDDVLVLGPVLPETVGQLYDRLTAYGTFTWLSDVDVSGGVPADLSHFHYGKLSHRGARSLRLSDAWSRPVRYDYRPGGRVLVFGASGAMGGMHLMRAISASDGPSTIVAVARDGKKLRAVVEKLRPEAEEKGKDLHSVALDSEAWASALRDLAPDGFDDVVVVAPGAAAMNTAIPFLARDGLLVGFAGTAAGERVDLPLGRLVTGGISLTASSGSTLADLRKVMRDCLAGALAPESLVVAVGGFAATREAIAAVLEGRFSGKVLILPRLDWPLTTLPELFASRPDLAALAGSHQSWSKRIEDAILGA